MLPMPVATWQEFIDRYYSSGGDSDEHVPPFGKLHDVGYRPKHLVLVPNFFEHRLVRAGWPWESPEEKKKTENAIEAERELAVASVGDDQDDGTLSSASWSPVTSWSAFSERYPDLKRAVTMLGGGVYRTALAHASAGIYFDDARAGKFRGDLRGDYLLLQVAFQNENNLAKWQRIQASEASEAAPAPWSPGARRNMYAAIDAAESNPVWRESVRSTARKLDAAVRAFWYYYGVTPRGGGGDVASSSPPQAAATVAAPRSSPARASSSGRGAVAATTAAAPVATESPSVLRRRAQQDEKVALEQLRAAEAEEAVARARVAADEAIVRRAAAAAAAERKRSADLDRFVQLLEELFPDEAARVSRQLGIRA